MEMIKKKEVVSSDTVKSESSKDAPEAVLSDSKPFAKQPILLIKSVSKSFKKKLVLRDINFEISENDIFGIVGMSGSGKTTLFELMAGLLSPDSGDVLVRRDLIFPQKKPKSNQPDYISVYNNPKGIKVKFGFASQIPSFYSHLTVGENMKLYGELYGLKKKKINDRSDELLSLVGLDDETESVASELSGGMQRRLDIACSMLHEPKILFMDEPTSDLDPVMRKQIWKLIKRINAKGTTVVLTSHILSEVEALCTKVAILHDKKVWGYGKLSELKKLFRKGQQIRIEFAPPEYERLIKRLNKKKVRINRVSEHESELILFTPKDDKNTQAVLHVIKDMDSKLVRIDVSDASLSEIFEMLAKRSS